MTGCRLCPRECGAERETGERGICGQTAELRVARAALHYWEEPCISGTHGSGAVFFCGCALHCVFCQNRRISDGAAGKIVSVERLAEIFLELQEQGAHNINLVTPGQFAPQIAEALGNAKARGLRIPVVCNTGGYEKVETLRRFAGLVDIYLPDLKYASGELAERYSHAPDYCDVAHAAIAEMVRQTGEPEFFGTYEGDPIEAGAMLRRGTIVRHLLLPGQKEEAKAVVRYLYETYGDRIYLSLLNQFTPVGDLSDYPELNRRVTKREYEEVVDYALALGVERGFIQEGGTAEESFIPAFDGEGV